GDVDDVEALSSAQRFDGDLERGARHRADEVDGQSGDEQVRVVDGGLNGAGDETGDGAASGELAPRVPGSRGRHEPVAVLREQAVVIEHLSMLLASSPCPAGAPRPAAPALAGSAEQSSSRAGAPARARRGRVRREM